MRLCLGNQNHLQARYFRETLKKKKLSDNLKTRNGFTFAVNYPIGHWQSLEIPEYDSTEEYRNHLVRDVNLVNSNEAKSRQFIINSGPPYANGEFHYGHVWNLVNKDAMLRTQVLMGKHCRFNGGWDCNGFPIEHKVLQNWPNLRNSSSLEDKTKLREICYQTAVENIKKNLPFFKHLNIMCTPEEFYRTTHIDYIKQELDFFDKLYRNDLVFTDMMPTYYSPSTKSALAESELEYLPNSIISASFLKFKITEIHPLLENYAQNHKIYALVWTKSLWSVFGTQEILYSGESDYILIKGSKSKQLYIISLEAFENLKKHSKEDFIEIYQFSHEILPSMKFLNANLNSDNCGIFAKSCRIEPSKGTGLVSCLPGHSFDDYKSTSQVPKKILSVFDQSGFIDEAFCGKKDLNIFDADFPDKLQKLFPDNIFINYLMRTTIAIDWRTKEQVVIRPSYQWFIDLKRLKPKALELIDRIEWSPLHLKTKMIDLLQMRDYWCISRQRSWGTPIPCLVDRQSGRYFYHPSLSKLAMSELLKHGIHGWYMNSNECSFTKEGIVCSKKYKKNYDVFDVWFDSGLAPNFLKYEADVITEGIDQARGWFQSMILLSSVDSNLNQRMPANKIIAHGHVINVSGNKLSKSDKSKISLSAEILGKNSDSLRYFALSSDMTKNKEINKMTLRECELKSFTICKSLGYIINSLANKYQRDFDFSDMDFKESFIIVKLIEYQRKIEAAYEKNLFHHVVGESYTFFKKYVSSNFININKNELMYKTELECEPIYFVQKMILEISTAYLKPIFPESIESMKYFCRELNIPIYTAIDDIKSRLPQIDPDLMNKYNRIEDLLFNKIHPLIARQIGRDSMRNSFSCKLYLSDDIIREFEQVKLTNNCLKNIFNLGEIKVLNKLKSDEEEIKTEIEKIDKFECSRCIQFKCARPMNICENCRIFLE